MNYISQIVEHLLKAQEIASQHGYNNLFQPGLAKELIIGSILGHIVISAKHQPDAYDAQNPDLKYEYLSCEEKKGTFQIDRMFNNPPEKRSKSLKRITRNAAIYCAVFEEDKPLNVLVIYKLSTETFLREAERKLNRSKKAEDIHLSFTIKWCEENGEVVYRKDS